MQRSDVDICNMALLNIGQGSILSLTGPNPNISQKTCKARYDEARTEALGGALWNFASLWRRMPQLTIDPKPPWNYVFQYPPDALKVFEILKENGETTEIPFEVTARPDADGKLIHCDMEAPTFVYVKDVVSPTQFSQDFVIAMSWLLASKIAMPITKSTKIQQDAYKMWVGLSSMAKASVANEGSKDADITASYQEVR